MIFFKKDALIYLKRQGLEIYVSGKDPLVFAFSLDLVSAEEIKDQEKLRIQLADFLATNKLTKLRAVIILAEELIYQKNTSNKEQFVNEIPFPNEKIVARVYPDKNLVLAANGELFKLLTEEIAKIGGNVSFVVPQTFLETPTINAENFRRIIGNKKLLKMANLLETSENKQSFSANKKAVNLKLPVILALILVGLFAGGGFLYFRVLKKPAKVKETIIKSVTQETTKPKLATESAVIKQKTKKDLTIKIFNGTGMAGDAKKVQDALLALDYKNIELDNLAEQNSTASAVIYLTQTNSYIPEITKVLKTFFGLEPLSVATGSASFDLQIITGK